MIVRGSDPEHAVSHLSPLHCANQNKIQNISMKRKCNLFKMLVWWQNSYRGHFSYKYGQKWPILIPSDPILDFLPPKLARGGHFCPNFRKVGQNLIWNFYGENGQFFDFPDPPPGPEANLAKNAQKHGEFLEKCPKMTKNGQKWPKMAKNGSFLTLFGAQISN